MFKCPYCPQQFSFESSRQFHINRHHPDSASASASESTPVSTSSLLADSDNDSTGFISSFLSSEATQPSLDFSADVTDSTSGSTFDGGSSDGGGASSNW